MTTVYTYFAPVDGIDSEGQLREIAVWRASWERFGWECKVLGPSHLAATPETVQLTKAIEGKRFPSVNVPGYDLNCSLRWVALFGVGGGLMADYDTVNLGYTPAEHEKRVSRSDVAEFCAWRTPAMLHLSRNGCGVLIQNFMDYEPDAEDVVAGKPHVSDMTVIKRLPWAAPPLTPAQAICQELDDQRAGCKVVHVSHHAVRLLGWAGPRWQIMQRLLDCR